MTKGGYRDQVSDLPVRRLFRRLLGLLPFPASALAAVPIVLQIRPACTSSAIHPKNQSLTPEPELKKGLTESRRRPVDPCVAGSSLGLLGPLCDLCANDHAVATVYRRAAMIARQRSGECQRYHLVVT